MSLPCDPTFSQFLLTVHLEMAIINARSFGQMEHVAKTYNADSYTDHPELHEGASYERNLHISQSM